MTPFPLNLVELLGHWESYIVYLVIGFAFGFVLELAGFGNSKKLAAQFYFKDMTVLKVMFTAIIVAMALIFLATGLGLLHYNLIWVNPTYLWPGIVGGLIMGVGFIIGGFCPGTSLVSAATLKIDGMMFLAGVFFGIFLFGETVGWFEDFWYSSYMGRYTLQDMLGLETGIVVLIIILAALFAFFGAEQLERIFGDKKELGTPPAWRYAAASGLVLLALAVAIIGQPTAEDRWKSTSLALAGTSSTSRWFDFSFSDFAEEKAAQLENREVQIHPLELLHYIYDGKVKLIMIDVRAERNFNLFHIRDAQFIPLHRLEKRVAEYMEAPANTLFVTISNDETAATEAWKYLVAESVPNVYILEGGINEWISFFGDAEFLNEHPRIDAGDDELGYAFDAALGARYPAAQPYIDHYEDMEYEAKVELKMKRGASGGGCG